jgi:hypothetical protein
MHPDTLSELTSRAARLVVEEGLDYGSAKRRALRDLGRSAGRSAALPSNEAVEDEVREYLALFCADTQPAELRALREVAARWMSRLAAFRPHLYGAAWRGTATRLSPLLIDLYCDDPKFAEVEFLNLGIAFDSHSEPGADEDTVLSVLDKSLELGERVSVHFIVHDHDVLHGALKPDSRGQTWRGNLDALRLRLAADAGPA